MVSWWLGTPQQIDVRLFGFSAPWLNQHIQRRNAGISTTPAAIALQSHDAAATRLSAAMLGEDQERKHHHQHVHRWRKDSGVLVEQQAKYCRENCQLRGLRVVELSGGEMDSWGKDRWRQCVSENEILVGTPEVFRKALVENGYITPLDFSIIIFDECHNATGNSPMAAIMKDAEPWTWKKCGDPQFLDMNWDRNYENGSLKNLEQKREQLETLLQASLFCPDVPDHLVAGGAAGSSTGLSTSKFRYVTFQEDVSREACSEAEKNLEALLGDFQNTVQMQVKECRKLVTRTCHVLEELGMAAFRDALKNCIQPQMDAHAEQLASLADEKSKKLVPWRRPFGAPAAVDLHREVEEALRVRQTQTLYDVQPKRRCLKHWSPDFGASTEVPGQVLPIRCHLLCWHEGAIYAADFCSGNIFFGKPGDPAAGVQRVAGNGNANGESLTGIDDLQFLRSLTISPTGEIFVLNDDRLVSFRHEPGYPRLHNVQEVREICCSPNGVLYVLTNALQKLVGLRLQTVMTSESLPADRHSAAMFVTKEEVIYILEKDKNRILRFDPAESFEPVLVWQFPAENDLGDFFVTECGTIYVADRVQARVFAIRPGEATLTEVLRCLDGWHPTAVMVQDRLLYVSIEHIDGDIGSICEYVLPPELQLE
eukprot:s1067_g2.t1